MQGVYRSGLINMNTTLLILVIILTILQIQFRDSFMKHALQLMNHGLRIQSCGSFFSLQYNSIRLLVIFYKSQ